MIESINLEVYVLLALNIFLTLIIGFLISMKKYKISVMLGLVEVLLAVISYYSLTK